MSPFDNGTSVFHSDAALARLLSACRPFAQAQPLKAFCILNQDLLLLACGLVLMHATSSSLPLFTIFSLLAGFSLVRIFIIQHDCGHNSFFKNRRLNTLTGRALSLLTLAPFYQWKHNHDHHHRHAGNIDEAATGYIHLLTVAQYKELSTAARFFYRLYRNPFLLYFVGIPLHNIILQRVPPQSGKNLQARRRSVRLHNAALLSFYGGLSFLFGFDAVLKTYLPAVYAFWFLGGLIFALHHQHEGAYWRRAQDWQQEEALLHASSFPDVPRLLHWLTGNILLHHIHHLCPKIPSYRLQECKRAVPGLDTMNRVRSREVWSPWPHALYDEKAGKMVSFRESKV